MQTILGAMPPNKRGLFVKFSRSLCFAREVYYEKSAKSTNVMDATKRLAEIAVQLVYRLSQWPKGRDLRARHGITYTHRGVGTGLNPPLRFSA